MRLTTLVIATVAVSSLATAAQPGLQFPALYAEDTLPYANLVVPQDPDVFTRAADSANQVPVIAIKDALLSLMTGGFLVMAGHRRLRHLRRSGRRRVRSERRLMA